MRYLYIYKVAYLDGEEFVVGIVCTDEENAKIYLKENHPETIKTFLAHYILDATDHHLVGSTFFSN